MFGNICLVEYGHEIIMTPLMSGYIDLANTRMGGGADIYAKII